MNGFLLKNIKNEYDFFKTRMISTILNRVIPKFIYPIEECYLIEEEFINELEYYLSKLRLPNKEPIIFNDFKSVINYIKNNKTISLISQKVIEIMGYRNILMNCKTVLCYGGNNKLIIKFKDDIYKKSFLLINPSNKIQISRNINIIMNNRIQSINENILNNMYHQYINNRIIISVEEYIKKNNNGLNKIPKKPTPTPNYIQNYNVNSSNNNKNQNMQLPFKENLLSIFIYIFYYEKCLNENNNKINLFNNNEKYYLINPEWFECLKDYYNYANLSNYLQNNMKFNSVNYNNLDEHKVKAIINDYYLNENILNFKNTELSSDLAKIENVNCVLNNNFKNFNNILFILEGIIIPEKIMKLIKQLDDNLLKIIHKNLIFKKNNIIYIRNNYIVISHLNFNLFIPKFVFIFNSNTLVQNEKNNILNSNSIIEYINLMKCNQNEKDHLQSLRNVKGEEIGKLIIINKLPKNKKIISNDSQKKKNPVPKDKNLNTTSGSNKMHNLAKSQESMSNGGNVSINQSQVQIINSLEKNRPNIYQSQAIFSSSLNQNNVPNQVSSSQVIINQNQSQNPQNQQPVLRGRKKEGNSNNQQLLLDEINKLKQYNEFLQEQLKRSKIEFQKNKQIIEKLQSEYNEKINKYEQQYKNLKYQLNESIKEINHLRSKSANLLKREKLIIQAENSLKQRELEVIKKEKEVNEKINFLEDKENLIEKENQEIDSKRKEFKKDNEINQKLKQEINYLISQRKGLINEINKYKQELNQTMQQIQLLENKVKMNNYMIQNNKMNENINQKQKMNENNNQNFNKKEEIIKTYKSPPLIGLNNIGSTCYKNSVLQCLSQTESLTNFFLRESSKNSIFNNNIALKNKNAPQLCPAYYLILSINSSINTKSYFL